MPRCLENQLQPRLCEASLNPRRESQLSTQLGPVPLKLLSKERRFDGGRGTEFYTFGTDHYRKITFSDMSIPEILKDERIPAECIYNALTNKKEISEELKELVKQTAKRSTFC